MTDIETIIEHHIDQAVSASRAADKNLWIAGCHAARIVGKYKVNATAEIASRAARDVSTVENWAHAYQLYTELKGSESTPNLRALRQILTISHFAAAWEMKRKYGYDNKKVMAYFALLLQHKQAGQSYSVNAMQQEIEAGENKGGTGITWDWLMPRVQNIYATMQAMNGTLPQDVKDWLDLAPASIRR